MPDAADHLGLQARLAPGRLAARDLAADRSFTYGELNRLVGQFAAQLVLRGIGPGDRVAVLARNCVECAALHLACARIGAIYVPLNWRLAPAEIAQLVADAQPQLILGDGCLVAAGLDGLTIDKFATDAAQCAPRPEQPIAPDRPSLILYTSGTSGRAKGVLLSEGNLAETAFNFSQLAAVGADSIFLGDAPMFHIIGLVTNIRPALMQGGAFLISDRFVPARTLQRLGDPALGVTHYFCVPQMAAALKAEPDFDPARLRGLTALFTGGAPHPAAMIRDWLARGIAVVDGYGMSEVGTVFGMPLDPALIAPHAGSVGRTAPRVRTRIVGADGSDCAPGVAGELLLKGDNVSAGYWRLPDETRAAFTEDGWFRTGDIVRADEEGYHWIVDRRKDMFISGGENVYPAEVEAVLAEQPGIAECAVVGVPDSRWGEVGHLFLVASPGSRRDAGELLAYLGTRLAAFKIPKHVSFLDTLPRNGAGKVLKSVLRKESVGAR